MDEGEPNMSKKLCRTATFEGPTGPDLTYEYFAEVSQEPNENGLDGGRIQSLVIRETAHIDHESAPPLSEPDAYCAWLAAQPVSPVMAQYEKGQLTLDGNDPHAAQIVTQLNDFFTEKNRDAWGYEFDHGIVTTPVRSRSRDVDEGRER
jgi:hypothetical protein